MIFKIMRLNEITKVVLDNGEEYQGQNSGPLLSYKEEEELAKEAKEGKPRVWVLKVIQRKYIK